MKAIPLIVLAVLMLSAPLSHAGESHDRARQSVLAGEILPLSSILKMVETEFPGELIATELEERHGRPVYEIKVLTTDGHMLKVLYDARSGERLKVKARP
ncbi:Predicted membrane protein [Candidatus Terasakiella magnetica]|nr:Predicted membrane protein [Candidatus Terasakiella magnetica]